MPTLDMALFDWTDYEDLKPEVWPSAKKKGTSTRPATPCPVPSPPLPSVVGGLSEPGLTYGCPELGGMEFRQQLAPKTEDAMSAYHMPLSMYQLILP